MPAVLGMGLLAWAWPTTDAARVARALEGRPKDADRLVQQLMPAVQKRVAWILSRHRPHARRNDVLDYTQEVFIKLFEDDGRILRTWNPDKGANLESFVQLVAERWVLSALRSGKKSAWREDPTLSEEFERKVSTEDLESQTWSKEVLEKLLDCMEETLTPRGWDLFMALYVHQTPPEEVAEQFEMSLNALYSWRSRFRRQAKAWVSAMDEE